MVSSINHGTNAIVQGTGNTGTEVETTSTDLTSAVADASKQLSSVSNVLGLTKTGADGLEHIVVKDPKSGE